MCYFYKQIGKRRLAGVLKVYRCNVVNFDRAYKNINKTLKNHFANLVLSRRIFISARGRIRRNLSGLDIVIHLKRFDAGRLVIICNNNV